jgi:hypothetical protein
MPAPKPVRHRRWKRVALGVTLLALVGFAAMTVSFFRRQGRDEGVEATRVLMGEVVRAVEQYRKDNRGELPRSLASLWYPGARHHLDVVPEDSYRTALEYKVVEGEKGGFRLRSLGADRVPDTPDDIVWPDGATW